MAFQVLGSLNPNVSAGRWGSRTGDKEDSELAEPPRVVRTEQESEPLTTRFMISLRSSFLVVPNPLVANSESPVLMQTKGSLPAKRGLVSPSHPPGILHRSASTAACLPPWPVSAPFPSLWADSNLQERGEYRMEWVQSQFRVPGNISTKTPQTHLNFHSEIGYDVPIKFCFIFSIPTLSIFLWNWRERRALLLDTKFNMEVIGSAFVIAAWRASCVSPPGIGSAPHLPKSSPQRWPLQWLPSTDFSPSIYFLNFIMSLP